MSDQKIWRVVDLLKWSKKYLADKGVESPQIEAEWMIRHVLSLSRLEVYLNHERPLNPGELARFKDLLVKRSQGIPIQYILGYTEFMGHPFSVNTDVLIPRPETELLVEKTLEIITLSGLTGISVLDVGTGSGCIAISLAAACEKCKITAVDVSAAALKIARRNADQNKVADAIDFLEMDILNQIPGQKPFNIIVSNPPYVAGEYWRRLDPLVKDNEPRRALCPGENELLFYERLASISTTRLARDGYLIVEIGGSYQETAVCQIFRESHLKEIEVLRDYHGESRVIVGMKQA